MVDIIIRVHFKLSISMHKFLTKFARQCPRSRLVVGEGVAVLSVLSTFVYSPSQNSRQAIK